MRNLVRKNVVKGWAASWSSWFFTAAEPVVRSVASLISYIQGHELPLPLPLENITGRRGVTNCPVVILTTTVIAPDESHKSACTKSSSYRMRSSTCSTGRKYRCHTTQGRSGGVAGLSRRPQRGAGGF
eukprot:COSAG06_NODE_18849_length_865_cov_1.668407_1_plen_127_part_01